MSPPSSVDLSAVEYKLTRQFRDVAPGGPGTRSMTVEMALLLAQDGIANGAIYVLVALGIVLIFVVTRVIFVPFGDIVAYAAMTLAAIQSGQRPGTLWLVLVLAALAMTFETASLLRRRAARQLPR